MVASATLGRSRDVCQGARSVSCRGRSYFFFFFLFFVTLVAGPRGSLSLKLSDTRVYEVVLTHQVVMTHEVVLTHQDIRGRRSGRSATWCAPSTSRNAATFANDSRTNCKYKLQTLSKPARFVRESLGWIVHVLSNLYVQFIWEKTKKVVLTHQHILGRRSGSSATWCALSTSRNAATVALSR